MQVFFIVNSQRGIALYLRVFSKDKSGDVRNAVDKIEFLVRPLVVHPTHPLPTLPTPYPPHLTFPSLPTPYPPYPQPTHPPTSQFNLGHCLRHYAVVHCVHCFH